MIPSALESYTGKSEVDAEGENLGELFAALDRRFPGIRFRVIDEQDRLRRHMRCFVNGEQVFDLAQPLSAHDEVIIIQALSGG
nr:MoaD/ThiS family protein [Novosphingobium flavum]